MLCLCVLLSFAPNSLAAKYFNISVNGEFYDSGAPKKINATFDWPFGGADVSFVLMTDKLRSAVEGYTYGDFTNFGYYATKFTSFDAVKTFDTDTEGGTAGTFGIISHSDWKSISTYAHDAKMSISFNESDLPITEDKLCYVYLWTHTSSYYYPDALVCAIRIQDGKAQYAAATDRNEYGAFSDISDSTESGDDSDSGSDTDADTTTYTVKLDANGGGGEMADITVTVGDEAFITENTFTRNRYRFIGWNDAADGSGTSYTDGGAVPTANAGDTVTLYAQWERIKTHSGGGGTIKYTVKFKSNGGTAVASRNVTRNNATAEPEEPEKEGYTFAGWYTDKELTNAYDFDSKVIADTTLYAKWEENGEKAEEPLDIDEPADTEEPADDIPTDTDEHSCPSKAFDDLDVNEWYHLDTDYVLENNLMNGIDEHLFAPNTPLTRGMLVTVLYRAENEPNVNKSVPFADVKGDKYFANAVIWAQQNGIVNGYSETKFAPEDNITREQIASILYRYAKLKGYDVSAGDDTNILSYADYDEISEYAIPAVQYAVGSGLMKGKTETTLNPSDNATRAEVASLLHRFIEANK